MLGGIDYICKRKNYFMGFFCVVAKHNMPKIDKCMHIFENITWCLEKWINSFGGNIENCSYIIYMLKNEYCKYFLGNKQHNEKKVFKMNTT